jgi:hypothetical protein
VLECEPTPEPSVRPTGPVRPARVRTGPLDYRRRCPQAVLTFAVLILTLSSAAPVELRIGPLRARRQVTTPVAPELDRVELRLSILDAVDGVVCFEEQARARGMG